MAEEAARIHSRITPETDRKIAAAMPLSNCQTENEFVEKALLFYCDYVVSQDAFSALHTTVQGAEGHIYRLLFKLAVEVDIILPMMRNPKKRWTMNRIWNINSITGLAA